jgi:putative transposase
MGKTAKKESAKEVRPHLQLVIPLAEVVRRELREFVIAKGMEALTAMLEQDRIALCGPAYARAQGATRRAGSAPGRLVMGGRRVTVKRPRVRDAEGEVELPSWQQMSAEDPLEERALEQMVLGVATRKYKRSLEPLPEEIDESGTSKSAVSRRFKAATEKQLKQVLNADLTELAIAAVLIDGIHVDDHVVLIALGIDEQGKKHLLGLWEGATENSRVCGALLDNLTKRGFNTQRSTLFVIDGSAALRKAIVAVFDGRAIFQRCQVHKRRNVLDHLPKELHTSAGKAIRDAYRSPSPAAAKSRLQALANQLEADHPGAATSLREGLDDTLTVKAMKLPLALERTLSTTNPIENLNGGIRDLTHRVKRWRGGGMILRWLAAAVLEHSKGFRRLRGHKGMPALIAALRKNDLAIDGPDAAVAHATEVA